MPHCSVAQENAGRDLQDANGGARQVVLQAVLYFWQCKNILLTCPFSGRILLQLILSTLSESGGSGSERPIWRCRAFSLKKSDPHHEAAAISAEVVAFCRTFITAGFRRNIMVCACVGLRQYRGGAAFVQARRYYRGGGRRADDGKRGGPARMATPCAWPTIASGSTCPHLPRRLTRARSTRIPGARRTRKSSCRSDLIIRLTPRSSKSAWRLC